MRCSSNRPFVRRTRTMHKFRFFHSLDKIQTTTNNNNNIEFQNDTKIISLFEMIFYFAKILRTMQAARKPRHDSLLLQPNTSHRTETRKGNCTIYQHCTVECGDTSYHFISTYLPDMYLFLLLPHVQWKNVWKSERPCRRCDDDD